jgi:hypothetical protein
MITQAARTLARETDHLSPDEMATIFDLLRDANAVLDACPKADARALAEKLLTSAKAPSWVCHLVAKTALASRTASPDAIAA